MFMSDLDVKHPVVIVANAYIQHLYPGCMQA